MRWPASLPTATPCCGWPVPCAAAAGRCPALLRLAGALRCCGGDARARQLYHQILAREPGHHGAHYGLGVTQLQMGDAAAARQSILRALRIVPGHRPYLARLKALPADSGAKAAPSGKA